MLVLEKKKCITLRVFSDWGCWYQAAPLSVDHSRRSLASLRGRRVAARDGVRRMRCLNLTRDLRDIHPVTGFRTLNEITSSIVPMGTTLTPPSSGGSCNSFSHATVAYLPQRNSLPSVHMRCRIIASLRATATRARAMLRRLATFMPHARSADHLVLRISNEWAASYSAVRASSSPHRLMRPCTSVSPDW